MGLFASLKFLGAAGVAALSLACAAPASAGIFTATQTGVVSGGFDLNGLFGVANASLDGLSYVAVATIDTSLGAYFHTSFQDDFTGGTVNGFPPPVTMTLTINGHTETIDGNFFSQAGTFNNSTLHEVYQATTHTVGDPSPNTIHVVNIFAKSDHTPAAAFLTDVPTDNLCSTFEICGGDFQFYDIQKDGTHINDITGKLVASTYVLNEPGTAVPEPATWAMMIMGFGLAGGALRRRSVAAA